jgi:signal recognition particle receptor subunit beta
MAFYDSTRNCHVVRIVYDGPGMAGKTTNLQQICELIPATQRTELYTPGALKGRTMFFDWLEADGPRDGRHAVKFQLITVPGQEQRNYRRRPLVDMADVVVFVADSSPQQIPDTMRTFARLRVSMKRREVPPPIVVQANKQDVPDAMTPERVRRRLRLDGDVPVLPAASASGAGVSETLITAMRIGLGSLKLDSASALSRLPDPETLFEHVLTFEDNPDNEELGHVEELHVMAEDVDASDQALAAHLTASSLDELEARARRAVRHAD